MSRYLNEALSAVRGRWLAWRFRRFEEAIHPATWAEHDRVLTWAERLAIGESEDPVSALLPDEADDPVVRLGRELRRNALEHFRGRLASSAAPRMLIHVPDAHHSPGGYSLFNNLRQALDFIGVPARELPFNCNIREYLDDFQPTVLLTSDHESYLSRLDWSEIARYRRTKRLRVGLTASLQEYGNTPLDGRLDWARRHGVDFYYSFRAPEHLAVRREYRPFYEDGFRILSVEFGANVLQYYPVSGVRRDLDYVFLASSNPDKWPRYFAYLSRLLRRHPGLLDGLGWRRVSRWAPQPAHRYLYARARVGLNLHIADSVDWPSELNERTYILAASGVPQLVDNAKLLPERFSSRAFYIATSPSEYADMFREMLADESEARSRSMTALREVYERHTCFHRAESLVRQLT